MTKNSVCLTGYGTYTPFGYGNKHLLDGLKNNKTSIQTIPSDHRYSPYLSHAALISEDQLKETYSNKTNQSPARMPTHIQASILACMEAWEHAKLDHSKLNFDRMGVIIGGQNVSDYLNAQENQVTDLKYIKPSNAITHYDSYQISVLSEKFNIGGQSFSVGASSASSGMAIIQAYQLIEADFLDVCLVVGSLTILTPAQIMSFKNLGAMAPSLSAPPPSPLDSNAMGFVYGQACSCIVLESKKSVLRRNIKPKGQLLSASALMNPSSQPATDYTRQEQTMKLALEKANLTTNDISYINLHATAAPLGDKNEIRAIDNLFDKNNMVINATKSILGHTLWSAAVNELISTAMQLEYGFWHETHGLTLPLNVGAKVLNLQDSIPDENVIAMSNAYGFGGFNCSIIYKSS